MKDFDTSNSLFILKEQQMEQFKQLEHFDYFFHLIRHDFAHLSFARYSVKDVWMYFYFEEEPVINSEHALIFLLRNFILNEVLISPKLKRLKKVTVGSFTNALMASVMTINLYLDYLREVLGMLPEDQYDLYMKFENSSKQLFNDRFYEYEHYPRKLVQIETIIIKRLRQHLEDNPVKYNDCQQKVIRFMDQYSIIKRELYEPLSLKK
ncbi:serine protease [Solibacillus sp. FSL W7-1464]|uniref:serine protease n=1 Tax=Solibacillus sp. FSL W7-1464 TaxID=2921706 RepID=UPI0030F61C38